MKLPLVNEKLCTRLKASLFNRLRHYRPNIWSYIWSYRFYRCFFRDSKICWIISNTSQNFHDNQHLHIEYEQTSLSFMICCHQNYIRAPQQLITQYQSEGVVWLRSERASLRWEIRQVTTLNWFGNKKYDNWMMIHGPVNRTLSKHDA